MPGPPFWYLFSRRYLSGALARGGPAALLLFLDLSPCLVSESGSELGLSSGDYFSPNLIIEVEPRTAIERFCETDEKQSKRMTILIVPDSSLCVK